MPGLNRTASKSVLSWKYEVILKTSKARLPRFNRRWWWHLGYKTGWAICRKRLNLKPQRLRSEFKMNLKVDVTPNMNRLCFNRLSPPPLQDQSLSNWQLKRQVGSGAPIVYKFPHKFALKAGASVTVRFTRRRRETWVSRETRTIKASNSLQVWAASGGGSHKPPTDLVWKSQNSWGSGELLQTTLINANGEVRLVPRSSFRLRSASAAKCFFFFYSTSGNGLEESDAHVVPGRRGWRGELRGFPLLVLRTTVLALFSRFCRERTSVCPKVHLTPLFLSPAGFNLKLNDHNYLTLTHAAFTVRWSLAV